MSSKTPTREEVEELKARIAQLEEKLEQVMALQVKMSVKSHPDFDFKDMIVGAPPWPGPPANETIRTVVSDKVIPVNLEWNVDVTKRNGPYGGW